MEKEVLDNDVEKANEIMNDLDTFIMSNNTDIVSEGALSKDVIPTGIDLFDAIMGGGICCGSMSQFVGPPGCGKSAILAKIIASGQKKYGDKFLCVYLDSENTTTKQRLMDLGVKNPPIEPKTSITVERVFSIIEGMCAFKEKNKELISVPSLIAWDSIANTPTDLESEESTEQPALMARALTRGLKRYMSKISKYNICFATINQTRDNMANMGPVKSPAKLKFLGSSYSIPGGNANMYAASQMFNFRPTADIKDEYGFEGTVVTGKAVKNKLFRPNIDIKMVFSFDKGFSNFWTNFELLKDSKYIGGTSWKTLKGLEEVKFRQRDAIKMYVENDKFKEVWDNSVKEAIDAIIVKKTDEMDERYEEVF